MRRVILLANIARLRVERCKPPLRPVRPIEYIGKRVLVTEPKPSRRRDLDIAFKLDVRLHLHRRDLCLSTAAVLPPVAVR